MKILLIVTLLFIVAIISTVYKKTYEGNVGRNVGEKHMREEWGIDEKEQYHE